jgi:hypothetical protein
MDCPQYVPAPRSGFQEYSLILRANVRFAPWLRLARQSGTDHQRARTQTVSCIKKQLEHHELREAPQKYIREYEVWKK